MTFISGLPGVLFAVFYGYSNALLSILVTVGLVISHAASNLFNDYWDLKEGVDRDNYFRAKYVVHNSLFPGFFLRNSF